MNTNDAATDDDPINQPTGQTIEDPVLAKRAVVARVVRLGLRASWILFALSTILFFSALYFGFNSTWATAITTCLILGCVIMAPAMVFKYAVKAADRADREQSW